MRRAATSSGWRTAGVKSATATISTIFLIPGRGASLAVGAGAVLGPQRDALAAGLHRQHASGRQAGAGVGPRGVEVTSPGGQVLSQAGQLCLADRHPGAGLDDLLSLAAPAGQAIGRPGADRQGVGVIGQGPPGIRRVQARLAPVAAPQSRDRFWNRWTRQPGTLGPAPGSPFTIIDQRKSPSVMLEISKSVQTLPDSRGSC